MDWGELQFFLSVADAGTLTAAARRLGLSVPTATRRIAALERDLGIALFDRGPRGMALTAHGRAMKARAEPAAAILDGAGRLATALREGASEPVRVSATEPIIVDVLAPALSSLRKIDDGTRVDLTVSNALVSLSAREADIAVRFAKPVGDSLVARRLTPLRFGLYCSAAYLAGRLPQKIDPLHEDWVGYDDLYGLTPEVAWLRSAGVENKMVARTSSTRGLAVAAAAGMGLTILPALVAKRVGGLIELPPPIPIPSRAAWLVVHRDLARVKHIRTVLNWVVRAFASAATLAG